MALIHFTKEQAKEEVKKLINKYNRVIESGRLKSYNEEMTKKEFIEPLFEILGWDVRNTAVDDEVLVEEKISKGRVDYSFRLGGIPKFFLEAKALKEDLDNPKFIQQAIDYSWHKSCTWAVLTDFEVIKIFNAEWKSINPLQAQFLSLPCHLFIDKFDQLWLLSKESFEKKLLDIEAERWGKKIKKIPVDKQLLADLTRFRELLTKNILKANSTKSLTIDDLDEAVQRIIDRLIFIRTLEDRELEPKILEPLIREKGNKKLYAKLKTEFRRLDEIYNSKLFAYHLIDQDLSVDDDILEKVVNGLFRTTDNTVHYDFSAIDADVLGNIYEQYLGHILKKTEKRAKLAEGKAHRKEQGIYYTPTYIVDYIVKNTIGELAKDKKFDLSKIKVLDPACGSGSFLMKAFDYLVTLDKKRNRTDQNKLDLTGASATYGRKVEILKNNIFGVDLDPKAVEIAQLNLLLKAAEKKHRLPALQENIKVGNSLIDDPEIAGSKAFKWEEQFKDIMQEGGFDVVIGNPPYVNIYLLSRNTKEIEYYQSKYFSAYKKFDLYVLFIEKAIRLLKDGGFFSVIIPDKFLLQPYGQRLREFILDNCAIIKIVDLAEYKIFQQATVDNVILVLRKEKDAKLRDRNSIQIVKPLNNPTIYRRIEEEILKFTQKNFAADKENLFRINITPERLMLKDKIDKDSLFVKDILYVNWGARSGDIKTFVIREKKNDLCKPMLDGRDIDRYRIKYDKKFLIYDEKKLYNPMFKELFENPKLLIRDVNAREGIKATYDESNYYAEHTLSICVPFYLLKDVKRKGLCLTDKQINNSKKFNLKYILGVLNSKLVKFYFKSFIGCGLHVYPDNVRALPIKYIPEFQQQPFVKLVDKMHSLNKRLNEIGDKKTDERTKIEEEIKKADAEIDKLVYKLYGLTDEEILIVEESLK